MAESKGRVATIEISSDGRSTWNAVALSRDATLNINGDEIDKTTRDDSAYRKWLAGYGDATLDFNMLLDDTDAAQGDLLAAAAARTELDVRFRERGAGSTLPERVVDCIVTSFSEGAAYEDLLTADVTLRLSGDFSQSAQA